MTGQWREPKNSGEESILLVGASVHELCYSPVPCLPHGTGPDSGEASTFGGLFNGGISAKTAGATQGPSGAEMESRLCGKEQCLCAYC